MDQRFKVFTKLLFVLCFSFVSECKYIEGELRTSEDWAFLTRFCFLSEQGTFEFYFEFESNLGNPNLLLYYDAPDQWPSVYKSYKTCRQKESVLHINQNQIVNLTIPKNPFDDLAGCTLHVVGDYPKDKKMPKTTPKPQKSVTFTVNLGTRRTYTIPMTTPSIFDTTTMGVDENATFLTESDPIEDFTDTVEDFDYNNTDIGDIYDVDNLSGDVEDNFNNSDIEEKRKPIEKRSVPQHLPEQKNQKALITCRNARKFKSTRARWWFIALSNCDAQKGIYVKYQVLMTNGRPGDYWHEHFSADEFYVLPVLMAFCIAYGMLLFAIIICSVELKSRQLLHTTYKLFVLSVLLQLAGIGLTSMAYLKYAVSGILPYRTKVMGGMFMGACETVFLLLLLLLAKGYTTTRGRLPLKGSIKLTIFMCLYTVTYLTIFIYEAKIFDPGEVLYLYESAAGYCLIVLRIVAWLMFIYSTIFTLKHYPEKSNFYYPFNICGTLWFVAGPAFILSANSYVDKWVRESVVCGVLLFITFAGHLMFLILTLPAMANKNFPYHIRTTQIGVMEIHGIAGTGTLDQFNHHAYQPTAPPEQTVIIPLNPYIGDSSDIFIATQRRIDQREENSDDEYSDEERKKENMDNVLKWSTVKGSIRPIENGNSSRLEHCTTLKPILKHPKTELVVPAIMGSSRSTGENEASANESVVNSPASIFRSKSFKQNDTSLGNEWTKDVPVELFTISKMVINKPTT